MALSKEFIYAFDDSGGVEPLLKKDRTPQKGAFPFTVIAGAGINKDLYPDFCAEWQKLMASIAAELDVPAPVPLHARLMFGRNKPQTYRKKENPYLRATQEQSQHWFLSALEIWHQRAQMTMGANGSVTTVYREERSSILAQSFNVPEALLEGEFLKIGIDRKRFPKLHQKYIAHATTALIEPTLDTLYMVNRIMAHCGGKCEALFDGYSDSSGFDESYVADYIRQVLGLSNISKTSTVTDADSEPLLQVADLMAYSYFRKALWEHRNEIGENPQPEPMTQEAMKRLSGKPFCSVNIGKWMGKEKSQLQYRRTELSARYAAAHYELSKYAPEIVKEHFQTPQDFSSSLDNSYNRRYVPILKPGTVENWQAERTKNGEDRS